VQCIGSVCMCVDKFGVEVLGTLRARFIEPDCKPEFSLTRCQSHYLLSSLVYATKGFVPTCLEGGSYHPVQCIGSVCMCVDGYGIEIPNTRKRVSGIPNCDSKC